MLVKNPFSRCVICRSRSESLVSFLIRILMLCEANGTPGNDSSAQSGSNMAGEKLTTKLTSRLTTIVQYVL